MQVSMYTISVPVFVRMLTNLDAILGKAAAYAEARKIEPSVLMNARLFPDMFPLTMQVRIAADFARGGVARLIGQEPPKYEDNETSFADLKDRIARSIAYVQGFSAAQIDGTEERRIVRTVAGKEHEFTGYIYLTQLVLPNLFFHITTAYDILRHNGVELGKRDYIGAL
jgi:hypothetical protein